MAEVGHSQLAALFRQEDGEGCALAPEAAVHGARVHAEECGDPRFRTPARAERGEDAIGHMSAKGAALTLHLL